HHVLMFAGTDEDVQRVSGGGAHGYDAIFVPGQRVEPYPTGMARKIPAGSQLIFQVHYTPVGSAQLDQTRVGMTFVDPASVDFEVRTASAVNTEIRIPPNDPDYRLEATSPRLPEGALLLALNPHMHLRGKSFFYEAVLPDNSRQTLLEVPHYDFNWQTAYRLSEPLPLPARTKMHCVAHFDNSAGNLNNPNPNETVRWGEQTWDEMMIGYFDYAVPIGTAVSVSINPQIEAMYNNLDKDQNDYLSVEEIPGRFRIMFGPLDTNGDGKLSLEEFEGASKLINRKKEAANE
ncbi:MAG: EF-hand domain-containing protein, partial [Aureliella sp.]